MPLRLRLLIAFVLPALAVLVALPAHAPAATDLVPAALTSPVSPVGGDGADPADSDATPGDAAADPADSDATPGDAAADPADGDAAAGDDVAPGDAAASTPDDPGAAAPATTAGAPTPPPAVSTALSGPAQARFRSSEVVVRYTDAGAHAARLSDDARTRIVHLRPGQSVADAAARLRKRPGVLSATANYVARVADWPADPGRGLALGGWQALQWNFMPQEGVNAPLAWQHLVAAGHPGGRGVVVAVLDTGVAYANHGKYKRSPDLSASRFVRGYDFVGNDPYPDDENGHGTHVASTIGETTGNGVGVTGLAYGVKLMPVRVLDRNGEGDSSVIAKGIRFAADHGAKIINMSFEFGTDVTSGDIPEILDAIAHARAKGVLVVGASGNEAASAVAYPARAADVLSVGATTAHGCEADYSNDGPDLDIVAPGGGDDSANLPDDPNCQPNGPQGGDIYQMTFEHTHDVDVFGLPHGYIGTSMATPHVSATAALVVASGILGPNPSPAAITRRLEQTARDLGTPGPDQHYGYGLVDAGKATDPSVPVT